MLKKNVKIGVIGYLNPLDKRNYSGTLNKIFTTLAEMGAQVEWIPDRASLLYRIYSKTGDLLCRLMGKRFLSIHTFFGAWLTSKTVDRRRIEDVDLLFAPFFNTLLYYLKFDRPLIFLNDATFCQMIDYYPYFSNLHPTVVRQGNQLERGVFDRSSALIFSSDWAKQSAIKDYGQPAEKIEVIEFGANVDTSDITFNTAKPADTLHLLFLAVEWERKGGDIAVETCRLLNERGLKTVLHVVGIRPPYPASAQGLPFVDFVGFLNKNNPDEYRRLIDCINICHCMLLPTLAECSAIAFCEASAYGLPCFTHDTGGVGNYIINGQNGYRLPLGSTADDFARRISDSFHSGEIAAMSLTAGKIAEERLNWKVWAEKMEKVIEKII